MRFPGFKIIEYRMKRGWTQADLCARTGLAQANLSNIEKGKKDFTVSTLLRIASALEVEPAELLEEGKAERPLTLGRTEIEKLAESVARPQLKVSAQLRETADLFQTILGTETKSSASQKTERAWNQLRQRFSSGEIKTICQRIEDARMRKHA